MRLLRPKPYMYALLCPLRLLPSTSKSFRSGKSTLRASASMPRRSAPSGRGLYVLKSGAMSVGYAVSTTSCSAVKKAQR